MFLAARRSLECVQVCSKEAQLRNLCLQGLALTALQLQLVAGDDVPSARCSQDHSAMPGSLSAQSPQWAAGRMGAASDGNQHVSSILSLLDAPLPPRLCSKTSALFDRAALCIPSPAKSGGVRLSC